MPQQKMINRNEIPYKNIDETIIKVKNCLQAKLVLNEPLTPKQAHMIQSYCKFQLTDDLKEITFSTQNSWKGLIMAFLSIAYSICRYQLVGYIRNDSQYLITQVSYDYEALLSILRHTHLDETDNRIEQIAAPPSWRPCYVTAKDGYTPTVIEESLKNFAKILDLDTKKSEFVTQYTNNIPHEYKSRPAEREDVTQDSICNYYPFSPKPTYFEEMSCLLPKQKVKRLWHCIAGCVEGVGIVSNDVMKTLCGNRWLVVANDLSEILHFPEIVEMYDDYGHPAPFWGYAISSETISYLCKTFPYLETELRYFRYESSPPSYVVFDKEYKGKWG